MELIHKLQKKLRSSEGQASVQQQIATRASTIKTINESNSEYLHGVQQKFTRQFNNYKVQQQRTSTRIHDTYQSNLEAQQWYDLQKKILSDHLKENEELKKYQQIVQNNQAFNEQCRKEIQKEQIAIKANSEGQFQSNLDKPIRKFQQIQNRLPKGKGVYIHEKQDKIIIRINKNGPYQNFGQNQLLQYQLIFSKEHKKFLPAGNYPKEINKLISYFNFHRDLGLLEKELQELNCLNIYA